MPNRPISFEFLADVADYLRDVKGMAVPMEDLAEAFVGVTTDADDMERKLKRAMRDAAGDTEVLEKALKGVGDAAKNAADDADTHMRRVGDTMHRTADDAGEAGREVGDEFRQNLGESLASGDLSGVLSDTIGGLVSSMQGAAGAIFLPLGAAALLAFNRVKADWEATTQAIAQQAESMWSTAFESIGEGVGKVQIQITNAALAQQELTRLWQESGEEMQKLVEAGEALNINANDLVLARAGDEQALGRVKTALDEVYKTQNATGEATVEQIGAVQEVEKAIYKADTAQGQLNAKVDAYNASLPEVAAATDLIRTKIDEWAAGVEKTQEEVAILDSALRKLPNNLTIRLQADASSLRQLFPYGVGGGGSPEYLAKYGRSSPGIG